jgi:hypothetical protein
MTFNGQIPLSTDLISNSQTALLANNQFLANAAGNDEDGYYKLPNGLIFQWGLEENVMDNSTIGFNINFATCYSVVLTIVNTVSTGQTVVYIRSQTDITPTGFTVRLKADAGGPTTVIICWMAIGV